jgi:RNA 3'-terminal phosphate cyclase (ATP)
MTKQIIHIDGSHGEGGGQVLRTSISLSAITGKAVRIDNIRAGRKKPGLMRQHLTSIRAAADICGAICDGLELGADQITFVPGPIKGGTFCFEIGSAGGTCLVAQTILPILSHAKESSVVTITGGTHNLWAPSFDFLQQAFLPQFRKMGGRAEIEIEKYGFYPAGGGQIKLGIDPMGEARPLELTERGAKRDERVQAVSAHLRADIAQREIKTILHRLNLDESHGQGLDVEAPGSGNVVSLFLDYEHVTEVFVGLGQHRVRAETVANELVDEARKYFLSEAAVGPHLADQLLLPMSLLAGGQFTTTDLSLHTQTNIEIIQRFLEVEIETRQLARKLWHIQVQT